MKTECICSRKKHNNMSAGYYISYDDLIIVYPNGTIIMLDEYNDVIWETGKKNDGNNWIVLYPNEVAGPLLKIDNL